MQDERFQFSMVPLIIVLFVLALLTSCVSMGVHRDGSGDRGRKVPSVRANAKNLTSDGVSSKLDKAHQLECAKQAERVERETPVVAKRSQDEGQPTRVATSGGTVQSGHGHGLSLSAHDVSYPGVSQEMVAIELAARSAGFSLPVLAGPVVDRMALGSDTAALTATCPNDRSPVTMSEQAACNRRDINVLLKFHQRSQP